MEALPPKLSRSTQERLLLLSVFQSAGKEATWKLFTRAVVESAWQITSGGMLPGDHIELFLLPGELTRPQDRPVRLKELPLIERLVQDILAKAAKITPSLG